MLAICLGIRGIKQSGMYCYQKIISVALGAHTTPSLIILLYSTNQIFMMVLATFLLASTVYFIWLQVHLLYIIPFKNWIWTNVCVSGPQWASVSLALWCCCTTLAIWGAILQLSSSLCSFIKTSFSPSALCLLSCFLDLLVTATCTTSPSMHKHTYISYMSHTQKFYIEQHGQTYKTLRYGKMSVSL